MISRFLRIRFFLGSTLEEMQVQVDAFVATMCPGNFVDLKLWKFGSVYQVALVYAEVGQKED